MTAAFFSWRSETEEVKQTKEKKDGTKQSAGVKELSENTAKSNTAARYDLQTWETSACNNITAFMAPISKGNETIHELHGGFTLVSLVFFQFLLDFTGNLDHQIHSLKQCVTLEIEE